MLADKYERLDLFLVRSLPEQSRSKIAAHISAGKVQVEGALRKPGFRLEPGMRVFVEPLAEVLQSHLEPIEIPLDIIFEDEFLLVVNKPAGISVHPSPTSSEPTLAHALVSYSRNLSTLGGEFRPGIVHRLDKDTSGLLLVAKTDAVHRALQKAIQEREVSRLYTVFVRGVPDKPEFTIRCYLGRHPKNRKKIAVVSEEASDARLAVTHCKLIESRADISQLECSLETGRTHQIRVHLASVGLPVLGDTLYGVRHPQLNRQALHAGRLKFVHPMTGKPMNLSAQLPDDLLFLVEAKT